MGLFLVPASFINETPDRVLDVFTVGSYGPYVGIVGYQEIFVVCHKTIHDGVLIKRSFRICVFYNPVFCQNYPVGDRQEAVFQSFCIIRGLLQVDSM